jgi:hypothetical protein
MLQEPMMNKLTAMRLLGMVDALKAQEQDPTSRELSFLERFGLLIDHEWNRCENQALARRLQTAKLKGGSLCRRDRLSYLARVGQESDSGAGAEVSVGRESRKGLCARAQRGWQKLRRLRPGAEGLPQRMLGALYARCGVVPRPGPNARRR